MRNARPFMMRPPFCSMDGAPLLARRARGIMARRQPPAAYSISFPHKIFIGRWFVCCCSLLFATVIAALLLRSSKPPNKIPQEYITQLLKSCLPVQEHYTLFRKRPRIIKLLLACCICRRHSSRAATTACVYSAAVVKHIHVSPCTVQLAC